MLVEFDLIHPLELDLPYCPFYFAVGVDYLFSFLYRRRRFSGLRERIGRGLKF